MLQALINFGKKTRIISITSNCFLDVIDPTIVVWEKGWKPLGSYYWNLAPIQDSRCIEVASRMDALFYFIFTFIIAL
jgi:hypothetical protein